MRAAAALSEHPLATHAIGECVGQLLEAAGAGPDLATLFVTGPLLGATEDLAGVVRRILRPRILLGAGTAGVIGGPREVEERAAVGLFGVWGLPAGLRPVCLAPGRAAGTGSIGASDLVGAAGTLVLVADPFSVAAEDLCEGLGRTAPDVVVVGGLASGGRGPGGNRMLLDGEVHDTGAVGVLLPPGAPVGVVVSQGGRPVGPPFTVTAAEGRVVSGLAGRPALDRLREVLDTLPEGDRLLAARGLLLGRALVEGRDEPARGDVLVHPVLGADRERRAIVVRGDVAPGSTVQFQVRDAATAAEDLDAALAGRAAAGAVVFSGVARGTALFGGPDRDAAAVAEVVGPAAVAGTFAAGVLGPVGGRPVLLGDRAIAVALVG